MAIDLKSFTPARIALGRAGHGLPTTEWLRFQLDHARARDAVYEELDPASLPKPHLLLRSQARDRGEYLRRPDLGCLLTRQSRALLERGDYDAAVAIADGLSATAVHRHAPSVWQALVSRLEGWRLAPLCVISQGRVAIGDEIGECLGAKVMVMLIGERPGLTAPDSLGIYLTWEPRRGRTNAERNCISNVRPEGIGYDLAAAKLYYLMTAARLKRLSGVALKEEARLIEPPN